MVDGFIGPCVHGSDPYDRCDVCGEMTREQAELTALRAQLDRARDTEGALRLANAQLQARLVLVQREAGAMRQVLKWVSDFSGLKNPPLTEALTLTLSSDAGKGWVSPEEHARLQEQLARVMNDWKRGYLSPDDCQARVAEAVRATWEEAARVAERDYPLPLDYWNGTRKQMLAVFAQCIAAALRARGTKEGA